MIKKLGLFFLPLFLLSSIVYGAEPKPSLLGSFEKGLNSHASDWLTPEGMGTTSDNVRYNEIFGGVKKRDAMREYGTIGSVPVSSLFRYYRNDGSMFLIAAGGDGIYLGDDALGTFATLTSSLAYGKPFSFINYQNVVLAYNGFDNPKKWDGIYNVTADTEGHRTAGYVMTDLGAPFAQLDDGTNLDAASWYQYRVGYKTATGVYYYSNAKSNPILTGSTNKGIKLTGIPLGINGTSKRIIYRTLGNTTALTCQNDDVYYPIAEINDNSSKTFVDDISDTEAVNVKQAEIVNWRILVRDGFDASPPNGTITTIHQEKLFVTGNKTEQSDVYWSDNFNPDFFSPTSYLQVRPDDGGRVTFLKTFLGILAVGKTSTIQKLYTNGSEAQWEVSEPFSFTGCIAPRSAAVTPKGIFYLGRDGIYSFTGQSAELVSDAVTANIRSILDSKFSEAVGYFYKNNYYLAYASDESSDNVNDKMLIFNTIRNAYTIDIVSVESFSSLDSGLDFGLLAMGSASDDGKVWFSSTYTSQMNKNLRSYFNTGTFDDARVYSDEDFDGDDDTDGEYSPIMEIAWDITIDEGEGTIDGHTYGTPPGSAIIDRPDTNGDWTSPIMQIDASELYTLFWNEDLNTYGDVTFQIRTGATTGAVAAASWSDAFTNPNYNDISGITANTYIQIKINLTTTEITNSPELFVRDGYLFRLTYLRTDTGLIETAFVGTWESGWKDLGLPQYKKTLKRIRVYYQGTAGTLAVNYRNDDGDVNNTFTINMAQTVPADVDLDKHYEYRGRDEHKIFTYFPPLNSATTNYAVGQAFRFKVYDSTASTTDWTLERIEVLYDPNPIFD